MYQELCLYSKSTPTSNEDYKAEIFRAISIGYNGFSAPTYVLKDLSDLFKETGIVISSPIDWPFGQSDTKIREHAAFYAIRLGVSSIDLTINKDLIGINNHKIFEDIKPIIAICKDKNITLRVILNYKLVYTHDILSLIKDLTELGIEYVLPYPGVDNDDYLDNIAICEMIQRHTSAKAIFNAPIWRLDQYEKIKNSSIFGIRLYKVYDFVY